MSTLLELPTATIEWALLSPLIVLLGVGCVGIVLPVLPTVPHSPERFARRSPRWFPARGLTHDR